MKRNLLKTLVSVAALTAVGFAATFTAAHFAATFTAALAHCVTSCAHFRL